MAGAVHRLERIDSLFAGMVFIHLDDEHIFLIFVPMARGHPELAIHDLRSVDFNISACTLFAAHVILEFGIDGPAVWMPKDLPGGLFLHMVQIHFTAQLAVVAFCRFFQHMQMGFELFLVGKCHTVDSLQHRSIAVATPIGAGHVHQFETICGHLPSVLQMRPTAKVLPITVPIHPQRFVARDGVDQLDLIGFCSIGVMLHRTGTVPYFGADFIALVNDFFHLFFDHAQVFWGKRFFAIKIIIPAIFDDWTYSDLNIGPNLLNCTGHDMGQIMAD